MRPGSVPTPAPGCNPGAPLRNAEPTRGIELPMDMTSPLRVALGFALTALVGCNAHQAPVRGRTGKVTPANDPSPVAVVDQKKIYRDALRAYEKTSGLQGKAALEDLIDLELASEEAKKKNIDVSAIKTPEGRAKVEYQLARALSLPVPEAAAQLVVDHAWVKDAKKPAAQAKQRQDIEKLRAKVAEGAALGDTWRAMKLPPTNWHVGDHETYGTDILPAEAKDLKANDVSSVMVGDGGLHLFKVYERTEKLPPAETVRAALHTALREGKVIQLYEVERR